MASPTVRFLASIAAMACACLPSPVRAQAPQAVMNAAGTISSREERDLIASQRRVLSTQMAALVAFAEAYEGNESLREARVLALRAATLAARTVSVSDSIETFRDHLSDYQRAVAAFRDALGRAAPAEGLVAFGEAGRGIQKSFSEQSVDILSADVPALFLVGPAVNFTLGYSYNSSDSGDVHAVELGTNLVGAAAASVFGALGEDRLAKFLRENLSVSTGFPTHSGGKLVTSAGVALGEIPVGRIILWPTLSITQVDTSDRRLPGELRSSTEKSWSYPALSVGILYDKWLGCFKADRCYPPVLVLGATAPQFYPGTPFAALGALFTDNREKYQREGKWGVNVGLAIPLRALKKAGT